MIFYFQKGCQNNSILFINAIFLIGMLLIGFVNPMAVVFAYVFETVTIGLLHLVKLFYVVRHNETEKGSTKALDYISIPFFLLHYGAFVAFQSIIIYTAFAINDSRFSTSLGLSNFKVIFELEGFYIVATSIFVAQIASLYFSFIKNKKYKNQNLGLYFMKPYLRIFIQQLLAILPFVFLIYTSRVGSVVAILLIVLRTALDFYFGSLARDEKKLDKLALYFTDEKKPEELPKIRASIQTLLEE